MDYEREYKAALERAKELYIPAKRENSPAWASYEYILPELRESEGERVCKELIDFIYLKLNRGDVTPSERERAKKWIAFLEGQGGYSKDIKANLEKEVERYMLNNTEFLLYADSKSTVQNIANYFYNLGKQSQTLEYKLGFKAGKESEKQKDQKPAESEKYDGNMDKECINLCNILNKLPGVRTFESCCGHLKYRYSIWFFCEDIDSISRLGRCVERNYSDGKWELLVDSTDTHPRGVFWLRSKEPFVSFDEMNRSITFLIQSITHWFEQQFDTYFNLEPAENEDDRVMKELLKVFSNRAKYCSDDTFGNLKVSEIIAWLEKQKPAEEQ